MLRNKSIEIIATSVLWGAFFFMVGGGVELFFPGVGVVTALVLAVAVTAWWGVTGKYKILTVGVVSALCLWGASQMAYRSVESADVSVLLSKTIHGVGEVIDDPSAGSFFQNVYIKILSCEEDVLCTGEKVLLQMDKWTEIHFGETITFACEMKRPENFSPEFDWRMYLAGRGVRVMCEKADVEVDHAGAKTLLGHLGPIRRAMEESVGRSIADPYSALGNGLLFGGSNRMSRELADDFANTSMTHITAVSGYNVGLIAGYAFSFGIFIGLWRRSATMVAVFAIVIFVLFIGSPLSALRAGVMGGIVLFCMASGRMNASLRALMYAGAIMTAFSPLIVRYDTGFQLSFLATLGIVTMTPLWAKVRPRREWLGGIGDIAFMTCSAQIFVLPVVLFTFGSFSVLSVLTNLLILWTIPLATLLTFATAILGLISGWLGWVVGLSAQVFLWYDIAVVQWFAQMEWSVVRVESGSILFFFGWYILIGALAWFVWRREQMERRKYCKKHLMRKSI